MASCRDCPCDFASCRDSWQEAKSHEQSLQEAISQAQQSRQEARDRAQSHRKPNMTAVSAGSKNWRTCLYPVLMDTVICFNFTASMLLLPNIWGNHNSLWIKKYALVVVLGDTAFVFLYFHSFFIYKPWNGKR